MKYVFFAFVVFIFYSCSNKYDHNLEVFNITNCSELDSVYIKAQKTINTATAFCLFKANNTDSLFSVLNHLKTALLKDNKYQSLNKYWQGYCYVNIVACQLRFKEETKTDSILQEGISILNSVDRKNSDHYALLSMLNGISIKYCNITMLSITAQKSKLYAEEAIKLNDKNMRAYLAFAINDFFTPSLYSGGKLVDKNLTKALKLETRVDPNIKCLPSWGKDMVYEYLIKSYIKDKKYEQAKKYLLEAIKLFPYRSDFQELNAQIK